MPTTTIVTNWSARKPWTKLSHKCLDAPMNLEIRILLDF